MKLILVVLGTVMASISFNTVAQDCSGKTACEAKICQIETQLDLAKQYNNSQKEAGLSKALEQAKAHCTTDGLSDELKDKIDDVKEDMAEHQDDLKEAIKDQKLDKVNKYKKKLAEDSKELDTLKAELETLK